MSKDDAKGFSPLWSRVQVNAEVVIPHLIRKPGTRERLQSAVETNGDKTLQASFVLLFVNSSCFYQQWRVISHFCEISQFWWSTPTIDKVSFPQKNC